MLAAESLLLLGPQNQSFRNKSGKTQAIRTKFGVRGHVKGRGDNVQEILGAIDPFWAKWGLGRVPHSQSIFGWYSRRPFGNFVTADFHQIWSRNIFLCPVAESGDIFENFHFTVYLPQNLKSKIGQTRTSLRAGYSLCDAMQRYTVYSTL